MISFMYVSILEFMYEKFLYSCILKSSKEMYTYEPCFRNKAVFLDILS